MRRYSLFYIGIYRFNKKDYDGDELNLFLPLDKVMSDELENFAPYYSAMDANRPYESSKFLTLLPPGNTIITNWIDSKIKVNDQDTIISKLKFTNR